MKVILRQDVKKLGVEGEVKEVSDGYARNYLIPRGLAVEASKGHMKDLELQRKQEEEKEKKLIEEAEEMKEKLAGEKVVIQQKTGEEGKLFGSVTNKDIAEALESKGYSIDKKKIEMEPIKALGTHQVTVKLHPEVIAELEVQVTEKK